jgi:hypothetical protein
MPSNADSSGGLAGGLVGVLRDIVQALKEDRLLLAGLAAAIVVALVAIAGPDDSRFFAALAAGMIALAIVVRAIVDMRAARAGRVVDVNVHDSNVIDARGHAVVDQNVMHAGMGGNKILADDRAQVSGNEMTSGIQLPPPTDEA